MAGSPDIALVTPGTTFGWRYGDEALARHIEAAGAECRVVTVDMGRLAHLRRSMSTTDIVEALSARRSAAGLTAGAIIYSSVTAALLQPPRSPAAVRFDAVAAVNRPGIGGAWQRHREPAVLGRANLLLPWGRAAAEQAAGVLGGATPDTLVLAPPIDRAAPGEERHEVLAYAANPEKRGLDVLCAAAAAAGGTLAVGGVDEAEGLRWLRKLGGSEPPGIRWLGAVDRSRWLELVAGARAFLSAATIEDWGMAQMEALAAGTPLVCAPAPGGYEALPLARRLAPDLVAPERTAEALARALGKALAMDDAARATYAERAGELLAPYSDEATRERVASELLPRLLGSSE